jgi:hypothetical protein
MTLGKPLGRFCLGSWAGAVTFPVVQIGEPLPIFNDAHEAPGLVGVRLLVGFARETSGPHPEIRYLGHIIQNPDLTM